jgi:4-hydroxybenzoate polyprenyltransferase
MKLLKVIRAVEWWEYKFPPILVVGYLILTKSATSISTVIPLFLFIIFSLVAGAVYVSILNDVTDIKDDHLAGKHNRMASYNTSTRVGWVILSLALAACFAWFMRGDLLSLSLYASCYIAFTLYSLPPFRLKKRGLPGIFADAAGSQLLPTLYAASMVSNHLNHELDTRVFMLIAAWSFCFGLRGILWHQFHDFENDLKSGIKTWVQKLDKPKTRILGNSIMAVELCALSLLLANFNQYACFASLGLYLLYLWLHHLKNGVEIITIKYSRINYSIFMNEYYQVFFPSTVLVVLSFMQAEYVYLLTLHVFIFPTGYYRILRNIVLISRQSFHPYNKRNT